MGEVRFRTRPPASGDDEYDIAITDDVDISFRTEGIMSAMEGGSGYALLSVNGSTAIRQLPSGTFGDFVQELRLQAAGPTSQCHRQQLRPANRRRDVVGSVVSSRFSALYC
jgi:hypothetical protein